MNVSTQCVLRPRTSDGERPTTAEEMLYMKSCDETTEMVVLKWGTHEAAFPVEELAWAIRRCSLSTEVK
jgi:hypothetical protein